MTFSIRHRHSDLFLLLVRLARTRLAWRLVVAWPFQNRQNLTLKQLLNRMKLELARLTCLI